MYPHPYFHYATFLTDLERYDDLVKHLDKCLTIATLEKSWIHSKRGIMEELQMNFEAAIRSYEKAILSSLNDDKIKMYNDDIERCKNKQEIAERNKL